MVLAVATWLAGALSVVPATAAAVTPDPAVGPHARDEARHAGQRLFFLPARTAPLPRSATASRSSSAAAPTPANGGLTREVFGFAPYWAIGQNSSWRYDLLSTVAYFGLDVKGDGSWDMTTQGWAGWNSQDLVDMVSRTHLAGDRAVLVIKVLGPNATFTIHQIATSSTATQRLIQNTIAALKGKSLDGVNVDFEGASGNACCPNIQSEFTSLMNSFTAGIHGGVQGSEVSVDTYGGSASSDGGIFKIGALAPIVDALFVMAYDMGFSNIPGHAAPNAPLEGPADGSWPYTDTTVVNQYLAKAPADKVILGVPYYGYKWCTVDRTPYSASTGGKCPDGTVNPQADPYQVVQQDIACAGPVNQMQQAWDPTAESPWVSWWSPASGDPCGANHNSWRELYYDNADSLGRKYDLVNTVNLRGAGMWALGYDGNAPELWNELALKFEVSWEALSGAVSSGPDAASWGSNRLDVFARGGDGQLVHRSFDGTSWSAWEGLGGQLAWDPAAVSWGPNRIDVFVRGLDNALWHVDWNGTAWSGWERLGGRLLYGPDVASWGANRLDIFAAGSDHALYHLAWTGRWSAWQRLGGTVTAAPGAVSWGTNRIDIVVRGASYHLHHLWWDGLRWRGWEDLGGSLTSGPDASSWGPGRLDIFARGNDQRLWHRWWGANRWNGWQSLGSALTADPAAVSWGVNRIDLFIRIADGTLQHGVMS
jgi:spore germination protein YaaH